MTCIVNPVKYPTKKALKLAVSEGKIVAVYDPSVFNERSFTVDDIKFGDLVVVTNHPKRSWFAQITRSKDGKLVVK